MNVRNQRKESMLNVDLAIVDKFKKAGFNKLTTIQKKALPVLSRQINALLVAPTSSGKTESAIIPIFTILALQKNLGIRVIYITPLRALNRDVQRRIVKYAELEGLKVEVRHGDTSSSAKKKMITNPPDILITTPETLAIILTNEKMLNIIFLHKPKKKGCAYSDMTLYIFENIQKHHKQTKTRKVIRCFR